MLRCVFCFGSFLLWLRGFDFAEVFQAVGDGDGAVAFAGFFHALGPDAVGEVGPIVFAGFQVVPAGFEACVPFGEAEELPERAGGDEDAVVEVGLPGELDDALDLVAQVFELVEEIPAFAGLLPVAACLVGVQLGLHIPDLGL